MIRIPESFETLPLPEHFTLGRDKLGRLCLFDDRKGAPGPLCVDFLSGKGGWRARDVSKNDLLPRAIGVKSAHPPRTVLDATAGLGADAATLALLGLEVTALEQSPVVHALLQDGIARAMATNGDVGEALANHLTLRCADARHFLRMSDERSNILDVVYLDPMFRVKKSALSRKEMQHLQELLPAQSEIDLHELFALALRTAGKRVVVKRPLHAPELSENPAPSHTLKGKSVRFDVYLTPGAGG
ncbi:MAG: class I SAM-dependent methyltransferase [Planctomycetes bacterium]|nr:class I SAM-dependent methyltransferase [Planctomycetota bacterium]